MKAREALQRVCEILREDELVAHIHLVDALDGLTVDCSVGTETFHIACDGDLRIGEGHGPGAQVSVRSDKASILALIDGDLGLLESVLAGRFDVLADISLMTRVSRAQRAFAEGAARARRVRPVLTRYRETGSEFA